MPARRRSSPTRVGDFGFLIALFLLIKHFGTLQYDSICGRSSRNIRWRARARDC